ncbi:hypothetical protein EYF80_055921 [Liparis tanakae]|uniref:Uncharacterized protein n=1 Tax=Liparis tanakae TaxID=230148 RepID=A0A4Z2EY66_9TELE|nr:hypothetical protein EYF80_055921 [Liparis tanakae]
MNPGAPAPAICTCRYRRITADRCFSIHPSSTISRRLTVALLGDLAVLVVPHHHGHRGADDVAHHLRRLAVAELLRRLDVPKHEAIGMKRGGRQEGGGGTGCQSQRDATTQENEDDDEEINELSYSALISSTTEASSVWPLPSAAWQR